MAAKLRGVMLGKFWLQLLGGKPLSELLVNLLGFLEEKVRLSQAVGTLASCGREQL